MVSESRAAALSVLAWLTLGNRQLFGVLVLDKSIGT
jgi:hypothetical protein